MFRKLWNAWFSYFNRFDDLEREADCFVLIALSLAMMVFGSAFAGMVVSKLVSETWGYVVMIGVALPSLLVLCTLVAIPVGYFKIKK